MLILGAMLVVVPLLILAFSDQILWILPGFRKLDLILQTISQHTFRIDAHSPLAVGALRPEQISRQPLRNLFSETPLSSSKVIETVTVGQSLASADLLKDLVEDIILSLQRSTYGITVAVALGVPFVVAQNSNLMKQLSLSSELGDALEGMVTGLFLDNRVIALSLLLAWFSAVFALWFVARWLAKSLNGVKADRPT